MVSISDERFLSDLRSRKGLKPFSAEFDERMVLLIGKQVGRFVLKYLGNGRWQVLER